MEKMIFLVDDNSSNLTSVEEVLSKQYRTIALASAPQMFEALEKFRPDLILLDVDMLEMSGFDAMKRLKKSGKYAEIPVIFLTGRNDTESEAYGIELGAVDFIMKPFSRPVLLNRIKNHLHIDEMIRERTAQLLERTEKLSRIQNGIVGTMADLVENRDQNTGGHIDRTTVYMKTLIEAMLAQGLYAEEINDWQVDTVVSSARLHDVGKIVIPDSILNKPGALTKEEFDIMKTHAIEGERIIKKTILRTGDSEFLQYAKVIAVSHHERWDGAGYPFGMKAAEIPLMGRIMAVIDVYDALVSDRPYKKAFPHEEAIKIITDAAGRHFDPQIAKVFVEIKKRIADLKAKLVS
ncbi:MAG: response regulator [Chitinispirillia bacterium]|nr:response regulator [Chitinispirillia bacterium]